MTDIKVINLDLVDSTNNYARGLVLHKEAEEGTVVLAQQQTNGRGHGKNCWESEIGKNLLCSILFKPTFLYPANQFFLSMVVSLGIFDFVASEVNDVKIKWPNDIYISENKIGGILIENTIMGNQMSDSVSGIGLNINQETFVSNAPNPVSLKLVTRQVYNLECCLEKVWLNIFKWYEVLKLGDFDKIAKTYTSNLFRINEWATYKDKDGEFIGQIIGVDEIGQLKIQTQKKIIRLFQFKEVEYIFSDKEV
jgi:BirA family biotin operon repressor/biotin-[acetyl-CoA-carboxylase] ligase